RDIKPENIMITANGGVKITDFSLARRTQDSMLLTREGQVMGTPHFMAPEQAQGKPVDARADIYSLGALIYVLVTGKFPFPRDNVTDVIQAHCEEPRPDPREHNPQVPAGLVQVIHKAMAIDRGERYASAEAMLAGLLAAAGLPPEETAPEVPAEVFAGELPEGTKLGDYTIQRLLGAGGMGHVYDVTHVRTGRRYALKTLLPDARLSADSLRRFEREARAASALGHPGLVAVHDFDRHAGVDFLVMDRLEGETLDERLRRQGTLPWETARGIARELADALDAAHAAGLLHRDVKPGNVFLARDGRGERAVLLDFGLAKPIDDAATSRITATGAAVGTPLYMSPEQARGDALDVRTDVYGLAATLYEMITGAPPFLEPTVARAYHRLLSEPALPASRLAPQPVPPELDALLVAALAKDPNARPADARRFAEALASVAA
ncbi:MAG: serine/threonine protein kinase, partial [Myxococcales bacterium]|nr:serine/threonine protein kinase [Myxococcales bacterium]